MMIQKVDHATLKVWFSGASISRTLSGIMAIEREGDTLILRSATGYPKEQEENSMLNKVIELIEAQKPQEGSLEYGIGEGLKQLAAADPRHAEIIAQDLQVAEMSLKACGTKLFEHAKKNKKGSSYFMPPAQAEKLIRKFYGLPGGNDTETPTTTPAAAAPAPAVAPVIDLLELL